LEYKLLGVGIPSRYSEYLLRGKKRKLKNGIGIDPFGIGIDTFDVELDLIKWN